jgi:hypothetical protein
MAEPVLLPGNRFRLYRSTGGDPETFAFVCIASTTELVQSKDFEDATVPDCDTPTAPAVRKSMLRSKAWNLSFSGATDAKRFQDVQADYDSEDPVRYQIRIDRPAADGGGTYTGAVHIENLTMGTADRGMVRFSATARGDGELEWAVAA